MQGRIIKINIKGVTLLNLMIIVAIVAIFSTIAIPTFTSSDKYQLELASEHIINAIRFARREAIRTGHMYGVEVDRASKHFYVYKVDVNTKPVSPEFIAYHPINKNKYSYYFDTDLNLSSISISNSSDPFLFSDSVRRKSLLFDANGTPVWFDSNKNSIVQLSDGEVVLSRGNTKYSVYVQPLNGRVSVQ